MAPRPQRPLPTMTGGGGYCSSTTLSTTLNSNRLTAQPRHDPKDNGRRQGDVQTRHLGVFPPRDVMLWHTLDKNDTHLLIPVFQKRLCIKGHDSWKIKLDLPHTVQI